MSSPQVQDGVFQWKLDKAFPEIKNTIFKRKGMKEVANVNLCRGFIEAGMGISFVSGARKSKARLEMLASYDLHTEQDQVKRFIESYNKPKNHFSVGHLLAKHTWGRTIPVNYNSLSVFHRSTRHRLCRDAYVDIDLVSAHPTIISQIAEQNGISVTHLKQYVAEPKRIREEIAEYHGCSVGSAKTLFISLIFGGSYRGWVFEHGIQKNNDEKQQNKFVLRVERELRNIKNMVFSQNPKICEDICAKETQTRKRKLDEEHEPENKRSVMALWAQTIERMIMETAVAWLVANRGVKLEYVVPCQDGFMLLKEQYNPQMLEEINTVVKERYGLDVRFIDKPFDEADETIPEAAEPAVSDQIVDEEITARGLAKEVLQMLGNRILFCGSDLYLFVDDEVSGGTWYNQTDYKRRQLSYFIAETVHNEMLRKIAASTLKEDDKKRMKKQLQQLTQGRMASIMDVVVHLETMLPRSRVEFDANPYLLGFTNGVLDLMTDEFRKYRPEDYITMSTGYPYREMTEAERASTEVEAFFESIQPEEEMRELLLSVLASGLDGRLYQNMIFYIGEGGNGKSLLSDMMMTVLGNEFFTVLNSRILEEIAKPETATPEMLKMKGKRYIVIPEMKAMSLTVVRSITGGGKMSARALHKDPVMFTPTYTLCTEMNNVSQFVGGDEVKEAEYRRYVPITYDRCFTRDPEKVGTRHKSGAWFYPVNPRYMEISFLPDIRYVFLHKLLDVYRRYRRLGAGIVFPLPANIRQRIDGLLNTRNPYAKFIRDFYEISDSRKVQMKFIWSKFHCENKGRDKTRKGLVDWLKANGYHVIKDGHSVETVCGIASKDRSDVNEAMEFHEQLEAQQMRENWKASHVGWKAPGDEAVEEVDEDAEEEA